MNRRSSNVMPPPQNLQGLERKAMKVYFQRRAFDPLAKHTLPVFIPTLSGKETLTGYVPLGNVVDLSRNACVPDDVIDGGAVYVKSMRNSRVVLSPGGLRHVSPDMP